jgi:hypothetical protein
MSTTKKAAVNRYAINACAALPNDMSVEASKNKAVQAAMTKNEEG